MKKLIPSAVLLLSLALWGAPAQAVLIDLSSPQEGTVVHPGDTVEMTATLTNDLDEMDIIEMSFTLTVEIAGEDPITFGPGMMRVKLDAGESITETVSFDIPAELPVPIPATATINVTAVGLLSGTEDSDSLSMTIEPLVRQSLLSKRAKRPPRDLPRR